MYVTDDDIIQTTDIVNRAFAEMQLYGLKLAQPSLCSSFESQTWQGPLFKDPRTVLHYTTFVEIMVPMFEMQFFVSKVVRTLEHAETGEPWCAACRSACVMLRLRLACRLFAFIIIGFVVQHTYRVEVSLCAAD